MLRGGSNSWFFAGSNFWIFRFLILFLVLTTSCSVCRRFQKQNWFLERVLRLWSTSLCFHTAVDIFEGVAFIFA